MKNSSHGWLMWGCLIALTMGCSRQPAVSFTPEEIVAVAEKKQAAAGAGTRTADDVPFPADKAGKLLSELLQPEEKAASVVGSLREPNSADGDSLVDRPEAPPPVFQGQPPRLLPTLPVTPVLPGAVLEEPALSRDQFDPPSPETVPLPAEALIHWPSPDYNQPAPLPILAQPRPDPAPLTDSSMPASTEAALAGAIPMRTTPAPFTRLTLPDPFENRQPARLRELLPEDPTPQSRGTRSGP